MLPDGHGPPFKGKDLDRFYSAKKISDVGIALKHSFH